MAGNDNTGKTGKIFVISAPSGAGKTTLTATIRETFENLSYSVSHTTRPPRPGEKEGLDYFFISTEAFEKKIQEGKWLEWAKVHGHYYGTSLEFAMEKIKKGIHLLLEIDVQGARQVKKAYEQAITVFVMPPSLKILEQRLKKRGTDSDEVIQTRMRNAKKEISQKDFYQYIVVNDDLKQAQTDMIAIFRKELS